MFWQEASKGMNDLHTHHAYYGDTEKNILGCLNCKFFTNQKSQQH